MIRGIDQPWERQPEVPVDISARLEEVRGSLVDAEREVAALKLQGDNGNIPLVLAEEKLRRAELLEEHWTAKAENLEIDSLIYQMIARLMIYGRDNPHTD